MGTLPPIGRYVQKDLLQVSLNNCRSCALAELSECFCARLTDTQLEQLSLHSKSSVLPNKTTLEDGMGPVIAVVEGVIGMQHTLEDGRRTISAYYTKGDIIDLRQRSDHLQGALVSLTKAHVCRLQVTAFQSVLEENHGAWIAVSENLREQLHHGIGHATDLGKKQAIEKLASFILECHTRNGDSDSVMAEAIIPMSRVHLAEYMGLQAETVSRGLRKLEQMGLIKVSTMYEVLILSFPKLKRIANGAGCIA